ncbi:MAG TPA: CocE/NonD family hydrolase [Dehalococcoidales bacterium]|nr:CocE/NonD family hydrolase [Dehalococcoidales bacterium]
MLSKFSVRIDRDVPVPVRDGTVLCGDIYRPGDRKKHPALLLRTPYGKIPMAEHDCSLINKFVQAGYAVIYQDVRGRYASAGIYDSADAFLTQEGPDGFDSVEWVAAQPWCDGAVGTFGGSYMARLQWMLGKENPPHLKAMAPSISSDTPASQAPLWYGTIALIMATSSAATVGMGMAEKLESEGKDASRMRKMLNQAINEPMEVLNFLPLKDIPHFDFPGLKEVWYNRGLKALPPPEQAGNIYWQYEKVTVPCLYQSGWYDFNLRGSLANYLNMKKRGGSQLTRRNQYLLIGPWSHGIMPSSLGNINFGPAADALGGHIAEHYIAYFDKYLRGIDSEIPAVRYFIMGENAWHTADGWPLPQTQWRRYFLHSRGRANSSAGNGILTRDEPSDDIPDKFIYDPHSPVLTAGGPWASGNGFVPGPLDQGHNERREGVLCYTTPELKEDLQVTGPLSLHLFAATSARDTDFTAKLVDVCPDGRSYNVAEGIVRARFRKSVFTTELLTPGEVIEYTIDLVGASQLFRRGHRIRLDVTSSNFPAFDRNMNTGNPTGEDKRGLVATQSVFHQAGYASYIDLPVITE